MNWSSFVHNASSDQDYLFSEDVGIISDLQYATYAGALVVAGLALSILGVITNAINIRVFVEQGLSNSSTNIGLLALSVFDLISCLFQIMPALCVILFPIGSRGRPFCIMYSNFPNLFYPVFYKCNTWTTVYLSVERSLCVMIPLKVKAILRPKVTTRVIAFIFLYFITTETIQNVFIQINWIVHPVWNDTVPVLYEKPAGKMYRFYLSLIDTQILSSIALFVVAISTVVMLHKLYAFQKWRQSNTSTAATVTATDKEKPSGKQVMSTKDADMVKSVSIATCIFLFCLIVGRTPDIIVLTIPGASFSGKNKNMYRLGYLVRVVFGLINSSVNFFFYMRMSSRYKAAFAAVFPKCFRFSTKSS